MKVSRDPEVVAGFTLEQPFESFRAVTHCGEAHCSRHHFVPMHTHAGIEVMYLVSGNVTWMVNRKAVAQSAGEACVVAPHVPHGTLPARAHPPFKALYVGIDLDEMKTAAPRLQRRLEKNPAFVLERLPEMELVLRALFQRAMTELESGPRVPLKLVELLLAVIEERLRPENKSESRPRIFSLPVQKAIHYLGLHLMRRVPVSELARVAHLAESHFSVLFRREVGQPPSAYHRQLRLEAAREALTTPDVSLVQLAQDLGFSSSQHLGTLFKSAFGCTLRQWRAPRQKREATGLKIA